MLLVAEVELPDGTQTTIEVMAPNQLEAAKLIQQMLGFEEPRDFKIADPRTPV
jgi:hypothetical protein